MLIRAMRDQDADRVLEIYQEGIDTGHATFTERAPRWESFRSSKLDELALVAHSTSNDVLGWAAASAVSSRCVYAGVAEVSVYVAAEARGRGVGRALLAALITASERAGYWTLQAGIFPENEGSLALHEALGFRRVGVRSRLGRMSHGPMRGAWRDVVLLERRSEATGVA